MRATDPQVLYMVLILPSLFGLTLIGEGLNKILKSERAGWISVTLGALFIGFVLFSFIFLSTFTKK